MILLCGTSLKVRAVDVHIININTADDYIKISYTMHCAAREPDGGELHSIQRDPNGLDLGIQVDAVAP